MVVVDNKKRQKSQCGGGGVKRDEIMVDRTSPWRAATSYIPRWWCIHSTTMGTVVGIGSDGGDMVLLHRKLKITNRCANCLLPNSTSKSTGVGSMARRSLYAIATDKKWSWGAWLSSAAVSNATICSNLFLPPFPIRLLFQHKEEARLLW
jgi:hypothetical protein